MQKIPITQKDQFYHMSRNQVLEEIRVLGFIDSEGNIDISSYYDVVKLRKLYLYKICNKHNKAFLSKRTYRQHIQQEHAY